MGKADPMSGWRKELVGFGLFFAFAVVWTIGWTIQETRKEPARGWRKTTARITGGEIQRDDRPWLRLAVAFEWEGRTIETHSRSPSEDGTAVTGTYAEMQRAIDGPHAAGRSLAIKVNPDSPAVIARSRVPWSMLTGIGFGCMFMLVGGWGIRRALRQRSGKPVGDPGTEAWVVPLVCSVFLLVGLGVLFNASIPTVLRWQSAKSWRQTPCVIFDQWKRTSHGRHGSRTSYFVAYRYEAGGRSYVSDDYGHMGSGNKELLANFPIGQKTTCWVDPKDPYTAVLDRSLGWRGLLLLFPLPFVAVGLLPLRSILKRGGGGRGKRTKKRPG